MSLDSDLSGFGSRTALVDAIGRTTSYCELEDRVASQANALGDIRRLILLEADNSVDSIVIYLACLRRHFPVVLTAPERSAVSQRIRDVLGVGGHFRPEGDTWKYDEFDYSGELHPELCVILTTSGSTGSAKFVRLSRNNIAANAHSIVEYLRITAGDRAATSLPPYYSYGLSVLNSHLLAGASLLLTNSSVADDDSWKAFAAQGCTSFSGVPHTFKILTRRGFTGADLPKLRYVTQAGGRLPPDLVEWMARLARDNGFEFFVMYGQTEATARMSYLPPELTLKNPNSIGIAIPGGSFHLVDEQGQRIVAANTPGELVYVGPNVMMGYAQSADDLAAGKSLDELHTGDIALRDEAGLHYIVGRKSRFLKLFGLRVNLDDVEAFVKEQGFDAIATGSDERLLVLAAGTGDATSLAQRIADWLRLPLAAVGALFTEQLPILPNGKFDYQRAKSIFAENALADTGADLADDASPIEAIFRRNLGLATIDPHETFATLGGDSLTYVQMSVDLEEHLGNLPADWYNMPLTQLQGLQEAKAPRWGIDTSVAFRALAIILIVCGHLKLWRYGGGGSLPSFRRGWPKLPALSGVRDQGVEQRTPNPQPRGARHRSDHRLSASAADSVSQLQP